MCVNHTMRLIFILSRVCFRYFLDRHCISYDPDKDTAVTENEWKWINIICTCCFWWILSSLIQTLFYIIYFWQRGCPWTSFQGTWDLPSHIPPVSINPTARSLEGQQRLRAWGQVQRLVPSATSKLNKINGHSRTSQCEVNICHSPFILMLLVQIQRWI